MHTFQMSLCDSVYCTELDVHLLQKKSVVAKLMTTKTLHRQKLVLPCKFLNSHHIKNTASNNGE